MSTEENKAIVRRVLDEVLSQGNLYAVDELIAPDFVEHEEFPGMPLGREGVKQVASMFRSTFPDLQVTTKDVFSEGTGSRSARPGAALTRVRFWASPLRAGR